MQAPIPEPLLKPNAVQREPRPLLLSWLIVCSILHMLLSFSLSGENADTIQETGMFLFVMLMGGIVAICLLLNYFLWIGANWARVLTIILCVGSLLGSFIPGFSDIQTPADRILEITSSIESFIWIIYLTRPPVVAFFKHRATAIA